MSSLFSLDCDKFIGPPALLVPDVLGLGSLSSLLVFTCDLVFVWIFFTEEFCFLSVYLTGVTLVVTDFCLSMAFCADAFRISVFDFLRRIPAINGGTNFLFLLGWMTLVIVLLSKKSDNADSLTFVSPLEGCVAVMSGVSSFVPECSC